MKAIQVHEHGDPDQLRFEDIKNPTPGPGEALVQIEAAGLNFIDTYQRRGWYKINLPFTPGVEAAGRVVAVGAGVDLVAVGDRVAYASSIGSYAEYNTVKATSLVPVPPDVPAELAAAVMLQGMTAHYLSHSTYPLEADDTALVHAAAGGVGQLLVQMAKILGARVIGTCSTEEKAEVAREAGADEVILYTEQDFEAETMRLTDGEGVDVVYDGVGKDTFDRSLACLRPRGYMVLYGQASGIVPEFDIQRLNQRGSLFLTRPSLGHYTATREELLWRSGDLFDWIADDHLDVAVDERFALADAAEAHRYIEGRNTMGKVLLVP
jgi:NADPH2:quinone reductase